MWGEEHVSLDSQSRALWILCFHVPLLHGAPLCLPSLGSWQTGFPLVSGSQRSYKDSEPKVGSQDGGCSCLWGCADFRFTSSGGRAVSRRRGRWEGGISAGGGTGEWLSWKGEAMGFWSCLHTPRRQVESLNPGPGWDGGLSTPCSLPSGWLGGEDPWRPGWAAVTQVIHRSTKREFEAHKKHLADLSCFSSCPRVHCPGCTTLSCSQTQRCQARPQVPGMGGAPGSPTPSWAHVSCGGSRELGLGGIWSDLGFLLRGTRVLMLRTSQP